VKQGERARGGRLSRQLARLDNITALVNTGAGTMNGLPVQFLDLPPRRHRVADLAKGFERARDEGYAVLRFSDYQSVICIDPTGREDIDVSELFDRIARETERDKEGRHVLELSSLDGRQFPGLVAPFTSMPIDDELVVDLLMGQRIFISSIDIDKFSEHIESRSELKVVDLSKEKRSDGSLPPGVLIVIDPSNHKKNFLVSIDALVEISLNLIDMDCYIECGRVMMGASDETAHWIPRYANEIDLWD
jgi:hypothetical protein